MSKATPVVSVLMGVYNGQPYLREAIESILTQTYKDFEFIIVDDCSDDGSSAIIEEYAEKDARIKLITNKKNIGLGSSLRKAAEAAKGTWVARMDADDISMPQRFEKQVAYAKQHPEIDIIGSNAFIIDPDGEVIGTRRNHETNESITKFIWSCPIIHPTVFMRRDSLMLAGSYGTQRVRQDYALWFRCVRVGLRFTNIQEPLLKFRFINDYFKRNNFRVLMSQIKICWIGCWQIRAEPIIYIAVTIPLTNALFPEQWKKMAANFIKKFDPRKK